MRGREHFKNLPYRPACAARICFQILRGSCLRNRFHRPRYSATMQGKGAPLGNCQRVRRFSPRQSFHFRQKSKATRHRISIEKKWRSRAARKHCRHGILFRRHHRLCLSIFQTSGWRYYFYRNACRSWPRSNWRQAGRFHFCGKPNRTISDLRNQMKELKSALSIVKKEVIRRKLWRLILNLHSPFSYLWRS